jgi:hypothetical protein
MRCPKCGFISFDQLGTCKKCNKNISELTAEIEGTVFAVPAPPFFHFDPGSAGTEIQENADDGALFGSPETVEEAGGLSLSTGEESSLDQKDDSAGDAEATIAFDDLEKVENRNEIILDTDKEGERVETENDDLQLDFGDIDISDLAPPEADVDISTTESLTLGEEEPSVADMPDDSSPASASVAPGSGLADLQVDDLDLEAPAPLVAGSRVGDKLMPSVKTGTALDDFDIDLGELISEEK